MNGATYGMLASGGSETAACDAGVGSIVVLCTNGNTTATGTCAGNSHLPYISNQSLPTNSLYTCILNHPKHLLKSIEIYLSLFSRLRI